MGSKFGSRHIFGGRIFPNGGLRFGRFSYVGTLLMGRFSHDAPMRQKKTDFHPAEVSLAIAEAAGG